MKILSKLTDAFKLAKKQKFNKIFIGRILTGISLFIFGQSGKFLLNEHYAGYFYSILSVISFQYVLDFGMIVILSNKVSYLYANITSSSSSTKIFQSRKDLIRIFRFSFFWGAISGVIYFLISYYYMCVFFRATFSQEFISSNLIFLISLFVSLNILNSYFILIYELTFGEKEVFSYRIFSSFVSLVFSILSLSFGFKLYSIVVFQGASFFSFYFLVLFFKKSSSYIVMLRAISLKQSLIFLSSSVSTGFKISISNMCGYFFYYYPIQLVMIELGPKSAGIYGFSIGIVLQVANFFNIYYNSLLSFTYRLASRVKKKMINGFLLKLQLTTFFVFLSLTIIVMVASISFDWIKMQYSPLQLFLYILICYLIVLLNLGFIVLRVNRHEIVHITSVISVSYFYFMIILFGFGGTLTSLCNYLLISLLISFFITGYVIYNNKYLYL